MPDTKNREPLILPLSDFLTELLDGRRRQAVNDYVFPGRNGANHLIEPRAQIAEVIRASGVDFRLHDLCRTFTTTAESLDISAYAVKRLVNYKMRADVTPATSLRASSDCAPPCSVSPTSCSPWRMRDLAVRSDLALEIGTRCQRGPATWDLLTLTVREFCAPPAWTLRFRTYPK